MKDREQLTKEGLDEIKAEYERLKTEGRLKVAEKIKLAREFGDISENAEYDAAKEEQADLEKEILRLDELIENAEIIEASQDQIGKVNAGDKVTIIKKGTENKVTYKLVGNTEGNPQLGKISVSSPVGRALLGREEGDEVEVEVPSGKVIYKILKIEDLKTM